MTARRGAWPAIALCALLVVGSARSAHAQNLPKLTAPVNDLAHVIDSSSAADMDRLIRALYDASKDTVVVATVDTFQPYGSIEEYAVKLFQQSGIGQRERDNGLLIVLAVKDRKVRIEVGYGLEEYVTDGYAGDTIRQEMLPAFRNGGYGAGLLAGTTRVINRIAEKRGVTVTGLPAPAVAQPNAGSDEPGEFKIVIVIILIIVILRLFRRRGGGSSLGRRRGPWSGWHGGVGSFGGSSGFGGGGGFSSGGGGGFGGFGGGRSGGGGASGGW